MTLPHKTTHALTSLALVALLALLAACSSPPTRTSTEPAAAPAPTRGTQTHAYEGGTLVTDTRTAACTITLNGEIHAGTVRRMGLALLGDAITLGAMLRNRNFDTQVQAGIRCETPCLLVFSAGTQRALPDHPRPAQVVFSRIPPDHDFGHQTCKSEPSRGQQLTLTRYLRAMLPEPTATAVYHKLLAADCRTADAFGSAEARAMGLATATATR